MKTKIRTWIFLSALILLVIVVALQFDSVKALRMRGDENLCMCAMRRPIRPTPEPEQASNNYQQPEQPKRNNDDDDEPPPHRSNAPTPVPTACVPHYHAPTLSMGGYTPPYPLVLGQDPDEIGVDVTLLAQGGSKTNSCPGDPRGTITTFQLDEVTLSPEAIARIKGELQKAYPGARVLGSYPLHPSPSTSLGSNASLRFHFDPQDPGAYNVVVTVTQHDGQTVSQTFQVPAHLLEATISW